MATRTLEYSDLGSSFVSHPITGDVQKVQGENAIKQSIVSILKTKHYDRLFRPEIGCNLESYLFDPINTITTSRIQTEVTNTINALEPRVELLDVSVEPDEDNNQYTLTLKFFIASITDPITFTTYLKRDS